MISINDPAVLAAFLTGVAGPVLVQIVQNYNKDKAASKKDRLAEEITFSAQIEGKLDEIKDTLKADRVWITHFHNGGHYYPTGVSIQKFSMFYEVVNNSVDSVKLTYQNIPVSLFSKSNNQILDSNIVAIPDFKDETIATYGLKHIAEESGTKSLYVVGIRDFNDKLIGTLGVEYVKRKTQLESKDITYIELEATSIGGVLSTYFQIKQLNNGKVS
jgi:hypothetical protein